MSDAELAKAVEVIPGRVWYVVVRVIPHPRHDISWVDAETPYHYWPFFEDYGPVSLGNLHRFCTTMNTALKERAGRRVMVFSGPHGHKRANAVFLLASWSLLFQGRTPDEAIRPFARLRPAIAPWHDATPHADDFHLTTADVLRGLAKARDCGFLTPFEHFDLPEYEHYEKVENGDMNWIVDGRFLAFAGPHDARACTPEGYVTTAVDDLVPHFRRKGVAAVVRLNKKYYNEKRFKDAAIAHHDMYYLDGSNPPEPILQRFLAVCEATTGAIAVHCKAGLGRTGTCIGAYLMKHYRVTAREVIGWMRVCRPGTVIGPQQDFLASIQARMWEEGEAFRRIRSLPAAVPGCAVDKMDRERAAIAAAAAAATAGGSAGSAASPATPVAPRGPGSTRAAHAGEDSSVRLIGGLTLAGGTPAAVAVGAAAVRRTPDGAGIAHISPAGSSGLAGPASASPVAKPGMRSALGGGVAAAAAAAVTAGGPPRVNVAGGPMPPLPSAAAASFPSSSPPAPRGSTTGSTLRSPSRLLQLFGSGGGAGSAGSGSAQSAADRAYGSAPSPRDGTSGYGGGASSDPPSTGRRQGSSPSGFTAFLQSITSRTTAPPREVAAASSAASAGGLPRGALASVPQRHTAAAPASPSSVASTVAGDGFSAASNHASSVSSSSSTSGFSLHSVGDGGDGVHAPAFPTPPAGASAAAAFAAPHHAAPAASPGSSPAATSYLTRSRARAAEAGVAAPLAPSASASPAAVGRAAGHVTPPRAHDGGGGGFATPSHAPAVGSQGDMLRSAKSASRLVQAGGPASPHVGAAAGLPLDGAGGGAGGHPSSSLRTAGASLLLPAPAAGGLLPSGGPPPKNPNFHVHGTAAAAGTPTPSSPSLFGSSRLLARYR